MAAALDLRGAPEQEGGPYAMARENYVRVRDRISARGRIPGGFIPWIIDALVRLTLHHMPGEFYWGDDRIGKALGIKPATVRKRKLLAERLGLATCVHVPAGTPLPGITGTRLANDVDVLIPNLRRLGELLGEEQFARTAAAPGSEVRAKTVARPNHAPPTGRRGEDGSDGNASCGARGARVPVREVPAVATSRAYGPAGGRHPSAAHPCHALSRENPLQGTREEINSPSLSSALGATTARERPPAQNRGDSEIPDGTRRHAAPNSPRVSPALASVSPLALEGGPRLTEDGLAEAPRPADSSVGAKAAARCGRAPAMGPRGENDIAGNASRSTGGAPVPARKASAATVAEASGRVGGRHESAARPCGSLLIVNPLNGTKEGINSPSLSPALGGKPPRENPGTQRGEDFEIPDGTRNPRAPRSPRPSPTRNAVSRLAPGNGSFRSQAEEGKEISGKAPWQVARAAEDAVIAQLRTEVEALGLGLTRDQKTVPCLRRKLRSGVTAEELSMAFLGLAHCSEAIAWLRHRNIQCYFAWLVSSSEHLSRFAHLGRKHIEDQQFAAARARREREARGPAVPKLEASMDTVGFRAALAKIPGSRPLPAAAPSPAVPASARETAPAAVPVRRPALPALPASRATPPSTPTAPRTVVAAPRSPSARDFEGATATRTTGTQTRDMPALAAPVTLARPSAADPEDDTDLASLAPRFAAPTPTTEQPRLRLVGRDPPPPPQGPVRLHMRIATSREVPVAHWLAVLTPPHLREGGSKPVPSTK